MIKDKRFLTGIGSGLIAGAILLQLMNVAASGTGNMVFTDDEDPPKPQTYTVGQLTSIADSLGFSIYDKKDKLYTQQEVDELIAAAQLPTDEGQSAGQAAPAEDIEGVAEETETAAEETETYRIAIERGMTSDQVAEALVKANFITEVDTFKEELARKKLENKIQVGVFIFPTKPSIAEIIAMITKA